MTDEYEQGKRDGRLSHLEYTVEDHKKEFADIRKTIKGQERVIWMLIGAFAFMQFFPEIKQAFG